MCGVTTKDGATLEIDHIRPVSRGGTNDPDNLQVLCRDCNAGKGAQYQ
jgi:5-methylcytosine-specific restriction endonuclease McrA